MASTKYTKSLATDFSGRLDSAVLSADIAASSIGPALERIDTSGDVVDLWFDAALSAGEETTRDTEITNHALKVAKAAKYKAIDLRTRELIAAGFAYDSKTFSTSTHAQTNRNILKTAEAKFTFPVDITTLDHDTYSLAQANLDAFWTAGNDALQGHLATGRVLKKSVFDAADLAAVDAVVDTR